MNHFKSVLTAFISVIAPVLLAQTIADFENFDLLVDTFDNGRSGEGGFASGDIILPNHYDASLNAWEGWSISTVQDSMTSGFTNQYASIAGHGVDGSHAYAVGFAFEPIVIRFADDIGRVTIEDLYITNATYTYLAMLNGDAFAKRFGGASGDEPDFLVITFRYFLDGLLSQDSINFYLADFRSDDPAQDYIIKDWTPVDLHSFGMIDSLHCSLSSSDFGSFGINTPTYFCVDNVRTVSTLTLQEDVLAPELKIFPNPASDFIEVIAPRPAGFQIYDISGQLISHFFQRSHDFKLDIRFLSPGTYFIRSITDEGILTAKLVKW